MTEPGMAQTGNKNCPATIYMITIHANDSTRTIWLKHIKNVYLGNVLYTSIWSANSN